MNVSFVSEGIKHFNCLFFYINACTKRKKESHVEGQRAPLAIQVSHLAYLNAKKQEIWWGQKKSLLLKTLNLVTGK